MAWRSRNHCWPQKLDHVGWEAYRALVEEGTLKTLYVVGWWEKYPKEPRSRILHDAHKRLVAAGADPGFATKALTALTESPQSCRLQALR